MLETLRVADPRTMSFRPTQHPAWKLNPFISGDLPKRLKKLDIEGFRYKHLVKRFTTVQELRIAHCSFFGADPNETARSVKSILTSSLEIRSLTIDCLRYNPNNFVRRPYTVPTVDRILHTNLAEISLHLPDPDQLAVLSSLILPQLRWVLDGVRSEESVGLGILSALSQQPAPFSNLITLYLSNRCRRYYSEDITSMSSLLTPLALQTALRSLPNLEALTFDWIMFNGDEEIRCLGPSCPRLHWLTFRECGGCTLPGLRAIVETRLQRPGVEPLGRLTIRQWTYGYRIEPDNPTERWMEATLQYERTSASGEYFTSDYLNVVAGVTKLQRYISPRRYR